MPDDSDLPALPWAAAAPVPDPQGVAAGLELQVHIADEEYSEEGWMDAEVLKPAEGQRCGEGRQLWLLNIAGDEVVVTFLSDRRLADMNCFIELHWRAAGSEWVPDSLPEYVTAADLEAAEQAWTRRLGTDVCDLALIDAFEDARERHPDADPVLLAERLRASMDFFQQAMVDAAETVDEGGVFGDEQVRKVKEATDAYLKKMREENSSS